MNRNYETVIAAPAIDRRDIFEAAARRLGTSPIHIEKDYYVCWILDQLFNCRAPTEPRLLFKGGTSLAKGFGLVQRFSEDIDVTVFRPDLDHAVSADELQAMSNRGRAATLEAIRADCSAYVLGPLREKLANLAAEHLNENGHAGAWRIEPDEADPEAQSLLFWYPSSLGPSVPGDVGYVRRAVLIESGAKSALDPHLVGSIRPYVGDELPDLDLTVSGITIADPRRTLWDKVVLVHGQRQWFDRKGEIKGGGHRLTRHYYDLHKLLDTEIGQAALADADLGRQVVAHARSFFNRGPYGLELAMPGSFTLRPAPEMMMALANDYEAMTGMIFGRAPEFAAVISSIEAIDEIVNYCEPAPAP